MTISELKESIENNTVSNRAMIFHYTDNDFLALQYLHSIAISKNKAIEYVDSFRPKSKTTDIFGVDEIANKSLQVYVERDTLKVDNDELRYGENIIVIAKNIEANTKKLLLPIIIDFPKTEPWQIHDYVKSQLSTLSESDIDNLITLCGNNIYRIQQEIDKFQLFNSSQYEYLLDMFQQENEFSDVTNYTIFNLTNAIQNRDITEISKILIDIDKMGIDTFALTSVLYQNFRKMIQVWLDPNPTEESTGIKNNQIWAIKNLKRNYTKNQLLDCFKFLLTIDNKIKSGELNLNNQLDYIINKILSF